MRGHASDIHTEAEEILKMRERLNREIAKETGRLTRKYWPTPSNYWLSAEEAKTYGIVGKIIARAEEM